ncbi:MAG: tRNA preQ1(34) S-adenosylmethionine ribosyltransferase-isomerase QueA [Cyclobacteriaceae bacterium]
MHLQINTSEFHYDLPEERIAKYPLAKRDQSKLLFYNRGEINHHQFSDLPELLPKNSVLYFNNTKVIAARLLFRKATGAKIEVFLLNPASPEVPVHLGLQAQSSTMWKCAIGNLKKWEKGSVIELHDDKMVLKAQLVDPKEGMVKFTWTGALQTFGEVIDKAGKTPLPPYLKREAESSDRERYQTVYSAHEGAVAAPTAGLHFAANTMEELQKRGFSHQFLTLHVSAGTFQPIKTENAFEHPMHAEQIVISRQNVEKLLEEDQSVIAVGTTSMRTLESLYWYGHKLLSGAGDKFCIGQKDPYLVQKSHLPSKKEALEAVISRFGPTDLLIGETSIYIVPGYEFKVCNGLISNFHQPGSTLMLLVAAFLGPKWRDVYDSALDRKYRFLSFGDSSFLIP